MSEPHIAEPDSFPESVRIVEVRRPGRVVYSEGVRLQAALVERRRGGDLCDQLLLLEHPHVITLGSRSDMAHVLADAERRRELGVEMWETGRGGDVTYHGPGQLVGYPILDLKPDRKDVHRYLRNLEDVVIRVLDRCGVEGHRVEGLTGVWTDAGKVAAIGIRISSGWITSHGFALNVATDLSYFDAIVPCGVAGREVTSLARLLGYAPPMNKVMDWTAEAFGEVFECTTSEVAGLP